MRRRPWRRVGTRKVRYASGSALSPPAFGLVGDAPVESRPWRRAGAHKERHAGTTAPLWPLALALSRRVAHRTTKGPIAGRLAGGTVARRLRRPRWPGAGGVLCPRRRASRGRFRAPRVWAGSPRDALPPCRRETLGPTLPVAVGRLARRRWCGRAAIPGGVACRITKGPIAGRLAGGTDARRLRRPRWPGAGGVLCPSRRASRGRFRDPRVWAGSPRDALPPCRRGKLGLALPVAVGRLARRRWCARAAIPGGVARRITGWPIAGRLAGGTEARRLRRPRWPGAGGVLCPRRRASRGRFRDPRVWAGSPRDALSPCRREALGPTLPVAVGRLARRRWCGRAAIPGGVARRITGGPIDGRLAGGTVARRLRRPRWPGAGGVLCPSRRASRGRFRDPRVWADSPRDAFPSCRRGKLGPALPVAVGRLARRRWCGRAAIPGGVARRITGGPIAGRLAGGTDARRLRRPRWPGAGGVLCPRRRASRNRFRDPRVWAGSPRDALSPCRRKKLVSALPVAVRRLARRDRDDVSRRKPGPSRTPPGSSPRPLPVSPPPPPALRNRRCPSASVRLASVTLVVASSAAADGSRWEEGDVAPPGRGWCRGTARGEPGSGGHDPHRHTGLVSPRATGIAPTLGVGPCGACNPAWRRAAAAGGPARGGGYVGRRALPRSHATGRHVPPRQAGAPGPDSPSSLLTALGDLYCIVLSCIGWSAAQANSH